MLKRILTYKNKIPLLIKKISNYLVLHSEKMKDLIKNMNEIFDKYEIKMTYFISTFLVEQVPSILESFEEHDFGPHGHLHLDYTIVGKRNALEDIYKSVMIFKKYDKEPWIFRAPYALDKIGNDPNLLFEYEKKLGIKMDSSINLKFPPWGNRLKPIIHECGITTIPLIGFSDDYLIDDRGLTDSKTILKELLSALEHGKGGLLVYDMHPIRMGQNKFKGILEKLVESINTKKDYFITSMKESVEKFNKKDDQETIVCFSGDIDNLSIFDYFRRIIM
ncbi:MAG: polysaccharide deacetylase family protein [Candidatus Helarchaeota archaeon]